jgi:hypothetical protein
VQPTVLSPTMIGPDCAMAGGLSKQIRAAVKNAAFIARGNGDE